MLVAAQQRIYDTWASGLTKQQKWEEAVAVYDKALTDLPDNAHLTNNLKVTWDQWAGTHIDESRWQEAADVYAKAIKKNPEGGFDRNLGYITQKWLNSALAADGIEGSAKVTASLFKQFESVSGVRSAVQNHFVREASTLAANQKFEAGLNVIDQGEKLFKDKAALLDGGRIVYDRWASSLKSQQKWQQAADVYTKGLKRYADDSHLTNNATAVWDSWARTHMAKEEWGEAIKVYEQAMEALPSVGLFKNNLKYCQQQAGQ